MQESLSNDIDKSIVYMIFFNEKEIKLALLKI